MQAPNEDYTRKNWASLMLINCEHRLWRWATPQNVATQWMIDLLQFNFLPGDDIGFLPPQWNRLVDEGQPVEDALIMHWTAGIPAFSAYRNAPGADRWHEAYNEMLHAVP
jgi:hypothetical protein